MRWHYVGVTLRSEGRLGAAWECPDFFSIEGHEVLMWSVHGHKKVKGGFQNPCSVVLAMGKLDRLTGSFTFESMPEVDYGPDFYAPQTLVAPDGRVIMIGWMQMWERTYPTHELKLGWTGQMTIPREISWETGRLVLSPVRELEAYRGPEVARRATLRGAVRLEGVRGQRLDLELEFEGGSSEAVGLRFFMGECEETVVRWEPRTGWLSLDRSRGGVSIACISSTHPECQVCKARVEAPGGALRLRVVLDRPAIEVFAQGGSTAMSATVYPSQASDGIEFFAEGGDAVLRQTDKRARFPFPAPGNLRY